MNPPKSEKIHLEVCQGRQGQGYVKYIYLECGFCLFYSDLCKVGLLKIVYFISVLARLVYVNPILNSASDPRWRIVVLRVSMLEG